MYSGDWGYFCLIIIIYKLYPEGIRPESIKTYTSPQSFYFSMCFHVTYGIGSYLHF